MLRSASALASLPSFCYPHEETESKEQVNIRNCHNTRSQTNPWHREEETFKHWHTKGQLSKHFYYKIAIIFLPISLNMCFGCSKEPSHRDDSFEYPQHMFWLRNKKNNFLLHILIWGPGTHFQKGAQWLSGRVPDSRPRGCRFEPHPRRCDVSLSKTH